MDHHAFLIKEAVRKAGTLALPGPADRKAGLLRILRGAGILGGGALAGYGAYKAISGEKKEEEDQPVKVAMIDPFGLGALSALGRRLPESRELPLAERRAKALQESAHFLPGAEELHWAAPRSQWREEVAGSPVVKLIRALERRLGRR